MQPVFRQMRFVRSAALAAVLLGLGPATGLAQVVPGFAALGVRELRGDRLPRPLDMALVTATEEGLVSLVFDERLAGIWGAGKEPYASREFFQPDEVLEWVSKVNAMLAWLAEGPPEARSAAITLGSAPGIVLETRAGVSERGQRSAQFLINRCRTSVQIIDGDLFTLTSTAAAFRRAALEAKSISPRRAPDDAVWFGHAIGCPTQPKPENKAPDWPPTATELEPHQELVQFVVDAAGKVEPGSERFLASSDRRFTTSIRNVLPTWRFTPATRMALPVRQLVHLNVGFAPPIVLGPHGRGCPDETTKGIVARLAPNTGKPSPGAEFLRGVASALALQHLAEPLHGTTIRFGYDRNRQISNPRVLTPQHAPALDTLVTRLAQYVAGALPALPARYGAEPLELEVEFGSRCEILFTAPLSTDIASIVPQGDGLIRFANAAEAHSQHLSVERTHSYVLIPASLLRRFVDTVATLLPAMDTSNSDRGNAELEFARNAPMIGTPASLGLHMWLSGTGWIRAGFGCGREGQGQSRFIEVAPSDFATFSRVARNALDRVPIQRPWTPRGNRAYAEHELTCDVERQRPYLAPAFDGQQPRKTSIESLVRIIVDTAGRVEPSSIEIMPGPDSATRRLITATVKDWTFAPAIAGSRRVRAQTHTSVIIRPMDADAVVLAASRAAPSPEDTLRRTVFFKPTAQPDRPQRMPSTGFRREEIAAAFQPRIDSARRTWPQTRDRFLRGLPLAHRLFVTALLTDGLGGTEQAFIAVDSIAGGTIHGHVNSQIESVIGWRRGDRFSMRESDLIDWTILRPDGSEEGNFVGKYLEMYLRRRR